MERGLFSLLDRTAARASPVVQISDRGRADPGKIEWNLRCIAIVRQDLEPPDPPPSDERSVITPFQNMPKPFLADLIGERSEILSVKRSAQNLNEQIGLNVVLCRFRASR